MNTTNLFFFLASVFPMKKGIPFSNFETCIGDEVGGTKLLNHWVNYKNLKWPWAQHFHCYNYQRPYSKLRRNISSWKTCSLKGMLCSTHKELALLVATPLFKCSVGFFLFMTKTMKLMYKLCKSWGASFATIPTLPISRISQNI